MVKDWDKWLAEEEKKIDQAHIDKIKNNEMIDARPLLEECYKMADESTEKKAQFKKALEESFRKTGENYLRRAQIEGIITDKEWKEYQSTGIDVSDIGIVLTAYYHKIDKNIKEEIAVLTMPNTSLDKNRKLILKKFGIRIVNQIEFMADIEKDPKFKEWKKEYEAKQNGT